MELTFLGQQSWAVRAGYEFVLVDPVLPSWFGTSDYQRFEISPPRSIDRARMPTIRAVVITNEHLDHFNLRSLRLLPKGTPVYFGELIPESCVAAAGKAGLVPRLLRDREVVEFDELCIRLYLCAPESAAWEKRVYHAVFETRGSRACAVIQSDGLISPDLVADLGTGKVPPVGFFVATNNAQVPPPGATGTYHNLLPLEPDDQEGPFGIRILHEVLCRVPEELGYMPCLALCGGGYAQVPAKHGPFLLSDAADLNRQLELLSLGQRVHFPVPGDSFRMEGGKSEVKVECLRADWVVPLPEHSVAGTADQTGQDPHWFDLPVFPDFPSEQARQDGLRDIAAELARMAPILMFSALGREATACNTYMNGPTGRHRFALRLYASGGRYHLTAALDINRCRFDWLNLGEGEVLQEIPFGVDVHLVDFHAVLDGAIQIWELATARMRQWYLGRDRLKCPIAFLYGYFSEQVRPDIAAKMYERILSGPTADGWP